MRKVLVKILHPFIRVYAKFYFSKSRKFNFGHIKGVVNPGVFHPQFTISTKLLLSHFKDVDLQGKKFLELGCGTGLVSVLAASNGAEVLASDINELALENAQINADKNEVMITTVHSDLFNSIPAQHFDVIVINPPYYPKNPNNDIERAWFCGEGFEYFQQLFESITPYFSHTSEVLMILSEDCDLKQIGLLAKERKLQLKQKHRFKKWGELNYLFTLESI